MKLWAPIEPERKSFADAYRDDMESVDVFRSRKAEMMFQLVRHLEEGVPGPTGCAVKFDHELLLVVTVGRRPSTPIRISVDSNDYAPLVNGMPLYHYRINYQRKGAALSVDRRCRDIPTAVEAIMEAIERRG